MGLGRVLASTAVAGLIAMQFIRPAITHPPVTAEIQVPAPVRQILRNSCYNCHSNETELAWFDRVVPAYWIVSRDVHRARAHLNFSEIGALSEQLQSGQDHGTYLYAMYRGSPLRKLVSTEEKSPTGRAAYILGQRAAVMP